MWTEYSHFVVLQLHLKLRFYIKKHDHLMKCNTLLRTISFLNIFLAFLPFNSKLDRKEREGTGRRSDLNPSTQFGPIVRDHLSSISQKKINIYLY